MFWEVVPVNDGECCAGGAACSGGGGIMVLVFPSHFKRWLTFHFSPRTSQINFF